MQRDEYNGLSLNVYIFAFPATAAVAANSVSIGDSLTH